MSKLTVLYLFLSLTILGQIELLGQNVMSFEGFNLPKDTALINSGPGGFFQESFFKFNNEYNEMWGAWSGWAISSKTDSVTAGFTNDLSSIAGQGHLSTTYAVAYVAGGKNYMAIDNKDISITGIHISNSTYAYRSMESGDAFAKKFGGISGSEPDFFKLTIGAMKDGKVLDQEVEVYLADFRSQVASEDFILKGWKFIPLEFGVVDSLSFVLSSSDNGAFGMNTPAYFCLDDVSYEFTTSTKDNASERPFHIYPNPSTDKLVLANHSYGIEKVEIFDQSGKLVQAHGKGTDQIVVSNLKTGVYFSKIYTSKGIFVDKFIRN